MEALKILSDQINKCSTVYLNRHPNPRKKLLVPCALDPPNPKCYVCASKPEIALRLNVNTFTVKSLEDKVLKAHLGMVAPDVEIDDGKGTILISSEEGETEENGPRTLSEFGISTNTRLKCDDFLQEFNIVVNLIHVEKLPEDLEFELIGDVSEALHPDTKEVSTRPTNGQQNDAHGTGDEDDDLLMVEDDVEAVVMAEAIASRKRKAIEVVEEEDEEDEVVRKRPCIVNNVTNSSD
jgi:ubiquitin-like 1-activating enzyme E1 B